MGVEAELGDAWLCVLCEPETVVSHIHQVNLKP